MLVGHEDQPRVVISRAEFLGPPSVDLVAPPRRLYADGAWAPPLLEQYVDEARVEPLASPTTLLTAQSDQPWLTRSANALTLLRAAFLIGEDPQARLTSRTAATLAHQVSLVHHVLRSDDLRRVLIADEVGLGKTIEAGLIVQALLEQQPGMRILYLAPARLVRNVAREFRDKLDLSFRIWAADRTATADLTSDQFIVASIHRAVNPLHRIRFAEHQSWDVLIVDEAHHLTAFGSGGTDSNRHYQLVRNIIANMGSDGRVLLLSGTPHQGNRLRFENLIRLIEHPGEVQGAGLQRVIFRTKEDVKDWNGAALFPPRSVNPPRVVPLGSAYRRWYEGIGELYELSGGTEAAQRASAWAKGQALQWAASSVHAGVGFLARMAIRRLDWGLENRVLATALRALRPYRFGPADEPLPALLDRMTREVDRQREESDLEDQEESANERWRPDGRLLERLLRDGVELLQDGTGDQKWALLLELLGAAPTEKVVLFAQPVETVSSLTRFIEVHTGDRPAVIVGGQSDDDRDRQIRSFWRPKGPRILVSSRAGGEGINLQVARRLIHLDVPWNPMEMEQRVGRIHRFGSRATIIVDTIVVEGTREVDAYRVARDKLRVACGDLANDPQRFEALFARVMSLVPPDEFEGLVGGSITLDTERLGRLVEQGLDRWREFHDEFATQQRAIREVPPGSASWSDLMAFAVDVLGAAVVDGYSIPSFASDGSDCSPEHGAHVHAVRLNGEVFVCDDTAGFVAANAGGEVAPVLGINTPALNAELRRLWGMIGRTGAAWLRTPDAQTAGALRKQLGDHDRVIVAAYVRQQLRVSAGQALETGLSLHLFAANPGQQPTAVAVEETGSVIRNITACTRQKTPDVSALVYSWDESTLQRSLATPNREQISEGIRWAVWPVFSAVIDFD
jgi:superfamily II DNA or RNA helicase